MKNRRDILTQIAMAHAYLSCAVNLPAFAAEKGKPMSSEDSLLKAKIPSSGEELVRIGLGTYKTFDVGRDAALRENLSKVLKAFVEAGGSLIDSSPMYGSSEAVVGDLSHALNFRSKLFMATKVWTTGKTAGEREMNDSLVKMKAGKMDLMQIHNLVDWRTHLPALIKAKEEGRFRYIGITHYTTSAFPEMEKILRAESLDFIQIPYSLGETAAEKSLIPTAHERRVAVIANEPFAHGALFRRVKGRTVPGWAQEIGIKTWAQYFLKYIIGDEAVQFAIPATRKLEHLLDNMSASVGRLPDKEQRVRMRRDLML